MTYLRKSTGVVAVLLALLSIPAEAQITVPYGGFSPGQVIRSSEVNANFAMFGDALNRTGGTMTGSLTVNHVLPEADNTRDLGSAALSFNDAWFDGTVTIATMSLTTLTCTGCVGATQLAATTVTAAAYGSASAVATFTVDADGRLTTAATTAIAIATSQVTSGNYVATVTAGSGIAVGTGTGTGSTPAFSLTALTADWTQSGAYDIVLSNASSELMIKESTGNTYYGVLEVGDLATDAIYTFSGLSGTVLTSVTAAGGDVSGTYSALVVANDSHTHDAGNLTGTTLATGVVTTSITTVGTIGTGTWNGTDVAVTAGGTGVGTFTANGILYGNTTSALQVTAAGTSAQILQASALGVPGFVTLSGDASVAAGGAVTVANDSHDHTATTVPSSYTALSISTMTGNVTGNVSGSAATFTGSLSGDVSGGQSSTVVANDSHDHTATTVSGLGTADFTSANISQWTNDSVYITDGNTGWDNSYGYITAAGTATNFSGSLAGDVTGTQGSTVVGNDSHTHDAGNLTGATLASGVTASSLTSVGTLTALTVSGTLTLSGTAANIALGSNYLSGDGGDEGILVGAAGNVSIGVNTDPDKQLYVYKTGAVTAASDFAVQAQNATTNTTTDGIAKFGVYALALGTFTGSGGAATTAYGIYASAADADTNWAGYFSGNIKITGTANEVGTITSGVWNAGAVTSSGTVSSVISEASDKFTTNKDMTGTSAFGMQLRDTNSSAGTDTSASFVRAGGEVGTITTTLSATAYNTSSDARLKTNFVPVTDLSGLRSTVVYDFDWLAGGVGRGVVAQEAYTVMPHVVSVGNDERDEQGRLTHPWSVDYSKFVPDLIVGWQQHDSRLATLEAQVADLTARQQKD